MANSRLTPPAALSSTWNNAAALALLLVPTVMAVIVQWSPASVRATNPGRPRPSLAFEQYVVDLHTIDPSVPRAMARFGFENRGAQPVRVSKVKPSCGCLTVRMGDQEFEPGESGEFFVEMDVAGEAAGHKRFTIDVSCTVLAAPEATATADDSSQVTAVEVRATIPPQKVTVAPPAVIFYQYTDEPTTQVVKVFDHRPEPLTVTEVAGIDGLVSATLGTPTVDPQGIWSQPIFIKTLPGVAAGRHDGVVEIRTADPAYPLLKVHVLFERLTGGAP